MVVVAGMWELGWNTPIKEIDLWRYPLKDFGVDRFYMTPISGIESKKVIELPSLEDILNKNKELLPIYVTEDGEYSLKEFKHPKNVLYIFGKTNYSPFNTMKTEDSMSLRIETKLNRGMLWGHQAAGIILYDRTVKGWQ